MFLYLTLSFENGFVIQGGVLGIGIAHDRDLTCNKIMASVFPLFVLDLKGNVTRYMANRNP